MKRQLGMVLVVLALFCVPLAWAQSDSTDSSSSSSGSSASDSSGASECRCTRNNSGRVHGSLVSDRAERSKAPPAISRSKVIPAMVRSSIPTARKPLPGRSQRLTIPSSCRRLSMINDVTKNTGLGFTMNVGTLNDYVWGGQGQPNYWENMLMTNGGIAFSQLRPTSLVQLGYTGGVNLSSLTFGPSNYFTTLNQTGNARILWNFAHRWQLRIKDNYLYSDDPFAPFQQYVSDPTPNQPNTTVFYPNAVIEQNTATADISYRLTAHDSLDFQGAESLQHLHSGRQRVVELLHLVGAAVIISTFSVTQLAAGGGYNFSALDFGHGQSRAGVQMFQGFLMYKFNPGLSVSGWVGPELTATKDLITLTCIPPYGCLIEELHRKQWDVAEGGTLSYIRNRQLGALPSPVIA